MSNLKHDTRAQRVWTKCCEREDQLRLKWFLANQDKLKQAAESPSFKTAHQKLLEEIDRNRQYQFNQMIANAKTKKRDIEKGYKLEGIGTLPIMKPVEQEITDLLYEPNTQHRKLYLEKRYSKLPENRYYFPETTSFRYGWKMFNHSKHIDPRIPKLGHVQILKNTFYRRGGIARDPRYYREPAQYSVTTCSK